MTFVPDRIKRLPFDERTKHHVPWFVADMPDGRERDFRIIDHNKRVRAVNKGLCWICGNKLGAFKAYVIGPMCMVNRITSEPPNHLECAQYAVNMCPFLSNPRMRRSPRPKDERTVEPAGEHIERNPGVALIFVTKKYPEVMMLKAPSEFLFKLPETYERLEFWKEGRLATEPEVRDAITTGMPILRAAAARDGPEAERLLQEAVLQAESLLSAHFEHA
jgi:hypothetical protein